MADKVGGNGQVTVERSAFDGSTVVQLSPAFMAPAEGSGMAPPVKMGAVWVSTAPDEGAVVLSFPSSTHSGALYARFDLFEVNLDGVREVFEVSATRLESSSFNTVSRAIYTESSALVPVPLAYLRAMSIAQTCMLRVRTSQGFVEANCAVPRNMGTATPRARFPEFFAAVEHARQ